METYGGRDLYAGYGAPPNPQASNTSETLLASFGDVSSICETERMYQWVLEGYGKAVGTKGMTKKRKSIAIYSLAFVGGCSLYSCRLRGWLICIHG
jgi:hypothetical protein